MSVLIIAEAGVNHNGDLELAKRLVASAALAGADIVKFQTFNAGKLVTPNAAKAQYQLRTTDMEETQLDMIRRLELKRKDHEVLIDECARHKIEFLSTAFDADSFDMLYDLGIRRIKVPSGELTNLPFLRHIAQHGLPVMLSTGMATLGEVEAAISVIEASGTPRDLITILHCTTEYPAPMPEVNLRAMSSMKAAFGLDVGYSDHTVGIEIPVAAVAMGATVIEKHFTLDCTLPGPDHKASLEPHELKAMVDAVRNVELALGDGLKRPTATELENKLIARKSLVARRRIEAGEKFCAENIDTKRPGTGICPMLWDQIIGREATRDFDVDEQIVI